MGNFVRYGVYHLPPEGADWAVWATRWLGWDALAGREAEPLGVPPEDAVTATPRRYGLHATLKPPFRLAEGASAGALAEAVAGMAEGLAPVRLDGLALARIGGFLALRPMGDEGKLNALAAACVEGPDGFRAPPGVEELARRRARPLSERQEANLVRWGYPHVMQEFRFHITLSGRLDEATMAATRARLEAELQPMLPVPYLVEDIALVGEGPDKRFRLISRHRLGG